MEIKIMDGKKELTFQVNGRHKDGSLIDFDDPKDRQRFKEAYIRGVQSVGYRCEPIYQNSHRVI